jgi:hypothetical protein
MLATMPTEPGVRFELTREDATGDAVRYDLGLEHAGQRFLGSAAIELSTGAVAFEWRDAVAPPEWCVQAVRAQLRLIYRDRANGLFPRRVTRWRPAPAGA